MYKNDEVRQKLNPSCISEFRNYGGANYLAEATESLQKNIGKYLIANVEKDGATKLTMRSINPNNEYFLWVFTVTRTPCKAGTYICEILRVPTDKFKRPFYAVKPILKLDEETYARGDLYPVFASSGLFTEGSTLMSHFNYDQNINNLLVQVNKLISETECAPCINEFEAAKHCVKLLTDGKVTPEEIARWLNEPSDEERRRRAITVAIEEVDFSKLDFEAMAASLTTGETFHGTHYFPYFAEKLLRNVKIWKSQGIFENMATAMDKLCYFLEDSLEKYEHNVSIGKLAPVEGNAFDKMEAYLKFDAARKAAKKATKKAAKQPATV